MAVDEAGLNEAAIERTPGGVGWDEDMGRFGALVKMLRLGGMASLAGLPLPDPKKDGFDAAVKKMFHAATGQRAPRPLLPVQGTETADDESEARDGEADAGLPRLQTPQLLPARPAPPPAPQPPSQQPPAPLPLAPLPLCRGGIGAAPAPAPQAAAPAGSAGDAAQPMEVEAPPGPAQTEAPPLLVPPSALRGLDLDGLVSQLRDVLAAAPLDEPMAGRLLDSLVGLGLSGQEMQDSGAPPPTAHMPSVPAHLHRAHPPVQLPTLHPLTAPHRRVQAGQQTAQEARSVCTAQSARRRAVHAVDVGRGC